jgi:heterodisulfide reductase subunit B
MIHESHSSDIAPVSFRFRQALALKLEGALSNYCYQCGACVGDCPAATHGEGFNPREIMLKALYGLESELLSEALPLWECTNCYNCYERCPQDVKPVEVIIALKNMLADRGIVPDTVARVVATFEETGRTAPAGKVAERQRAEFGLPSLEPVPMEEIRALLDTNGGSRPTVRGVRHTAHPTTPGTKRFAFFPGCLIPTRFPAMEFAIRGTLEKLGVEILDLQGASCCPDPIYFKAKDKVSWLTIAARNLCLAEDLELDVLTNCSGCTATLAEARHLLQDTTLRALVNERLARVGRKYRGTARVRHLATVLRDDVGYDAIRASVVRPLEGLKVAVHYGCHLLKPSATMAVDDPDNPSVLEGLVSALGATPVRHQNWALCCGKACQSPEVPSRMMHALLESVHQSAVDLLCLVCPTCFTRFDFGQLDASLQFAEDLRTPPVYYAQLLAFAQGVDYERLAFPRQKLKPDCLRRFEKRGGSKEAPNGTAGTGCEYCGSVTDLLPDGSAEGVFYCRPCLERFARHDTQIRERGETESGTDS